MSSTTGSLTNSGALRGVLKGSSTLEGTLSNTFLRGLSAYQEALIEGFQGTRLEWLESLNGEEVLLRENGNDIEWKYTSEDEWKHLISLEPTRDYDKLINKPTLGDISLAGTIDDLIDSRIISQFETIVEGDDFKEDFSLSNQEIENLLG